MTINSTTSYPSITNAHPAADADSDVTVCLVGDQFAGMAAVPGVHTLSEFIGDLHRGAPVPRSIILGQGVQGYELEYLHAALESRGTDPHEIMRPASNTQRVPRHLVHKHREQNVLLADLHQADDQQFRAGLRLHGENELLLDHQTGQHVQGLVITEAMRQLFIAVFELKHGAQYPDRRYYMVWNSISLSFNSFLYQLPAELTCKILEQDIEDPAKMVFRVAMHIDQLGNDAAHAEIEFAAVEDNRVKRSEMRRAASRVEALLEDSESIRNR